MAFDKTYPNRKDWRRQYYGAGRIFASCRPGGDCPWCQGNRRHQLMKQLLRMHDDEHEDGRHVRPRRKAP